jgi:type III restriction enzyme
MSLRIELKAFQESAVEDLFRYARQARNAALEGDPQALILAAPTGSGKTVIANALFDRILSGDEIHDGDPEARFLWLTDQPELNEQTKRKFTVNSDPSVFGDQQLITIDAATFNQPTFEAGHCYFLNTQKIGRGRQLVNVSGGDNRAWTVWDTINNSIAVAPGSFWVVIDEAHRGMQGGDPNFAETIVQRFLVGSDEVNPVPLILGISATPQRFQQMLLGTGRHQAPYEVKPEAVRASGLIKDWITVYHPTEKQPSDWTLLQAAAAKLTQFKDSWAAYVKTQRKAGEKVPEVEPLLVVQIEDAPATGKAVSKTSVERAIREIEDVLGPLSSEETAHSLQEGTPLDLNGRTVPYVAPPDIQDAPKLRVVFFKMALNTGWDCPRAEVMMSFRRAVDYTNIAQLVGRMVRTPLAEKVTTDLSLNSVALYLPHFDSTALDQVVDYLENPESEGVITSKVRRGEFLADAHRDPKLNKIFAYAATLPTYVVERIATTSDIRRLIRLARYLSQDKLDEKAYDRERAHVVALLTKEQNRLRDTRGFQTAVAAAGKVSVEEVTVVVGGGRVAGKNDPSNGNSATDLPASVHDVEDLYAMAGRKLGEGLHADYVRARVSADSSISLKQAKVELYALLSDEKTFTNVEKGCGVRFTKLYAKHQTGINSRGDARRQAYGKLLKMAKEPQATTLMLPDTLPADTRETCWPSHLFIDDKGEFPVKFGSSWERTVLANAMNEKGFIAWLRNEPRQDWSLCIPYEHKSAERPHYPDFLIFRKSGQGYLADVLEPHSLSLEDGWAKARGLARFAQRHGDLFGRIELLAEIKGKMKRLDLKNPDVREKVLVVNNVSQLRHLFGD